MRSVLVVLGQPVVGNGLDLLDGIEQPDVEHLGAEGAIEALDVGVLVGLERGQSRNSRSPAAGCGSQRQRETSLTTTKPKTDHDKVTPPKPAAEPAFFMRNPLRIRTFRQTQSR